MTFSLRSLGRYLPVKVFVNVFGAALILDFTPALATEHKQSVHIQDLASYNEAGLSRLADQATEDARKKVESILKGETFQSTFGAYDDARKALLETLHFVELVGLVSPQITLRKQSQSLAARLRASLNEVFDERVGKYLKTRASHLKGLSSEEKRYVEFALADLNRRGLTLEEKKRRRLRDIQGQIGELSVQFDKNVQEMGGKFLATEEELEGLPTAMLAALPKEGSKRIIGTDYPTVFGILDNVSSAELRRKVQQQFHNRAYPENDRVLKKIRELRHEMAQLLGFSNFAEFDLADQMAESPAKVREFLNSILPTLQKMAKIETERLLPFAQKSDLDEKGRIQPWSRAYLRNQYAKKKLGLGSTQVNEYFPVEHTLHGLFEIFRRQFGVIVTLARSENLWDPQVRVAEVTFQGKYRGKVYLDLYPREGKYTHGRVMVLRPSYFKGKVVEPGDVAILTNFTPPATGRPALFTFDEVSTLFHEFGHAIHALLIENRLSFMDSSEMAVTYGVGVKTDFVELPSQMMEQWLLDPILVRNLSHHYLSGKKLPIHLVEALVSGDKDFRGLDLLRQITLARFSLAVFSGDRPAGELWEEISHETMPWFPHDPDNHFFASFLHLTSYGAKYYSYLWTQVFAVDLFSVFKKEGLLKSSVLGKKYCRDVLSKGGSIHPSELLRAFLGRPVNTEAFLK